MKFKPNKHAKSIPASDFTECMTRRDENIFRRAFSSKPSEGDRVWVRDIFELTAEKLGLQTCQVIQAYKLGTPEHLCRIMADNYKMAHDEEPPNYTVDIVRTAWIWALSLRHPKVKVTDVGGKAVNTSVAKMPDFQVVHVLESAGKQRLQQKVDAVLNGAV